jgi:hypothetical protein
VLKEKRVTTVACVEHEFSRPLNVSPDLAVDVVKACVLHILVREGDGCKIEDAMKLAGLEYVPDGLSSTWG